MRYRELARKLRRLGCEEVRRKHGGSHRYWFNPRTGKVASIPDWGGKDLKRGTVRGFLRRLGIEPGELER